LCQKLSPEFGLGVFAGLIQATAKTDAFCGSGVRGSCTQLVDILCYYVSARDFN